MIYTIIQKLDRWEHEQRKKPSNKVDMIDIILVIKINKFFPDKGDLLATTNQNRSIWVL